MFNLSLQVDYLKLEREILLELKSRVDSNLSRILPEIQRDCIAVFDNVFSNNPTYTSLLNGVLRTDFGLTDPAQTLLEISNYLKLNIFYRKNSTSVRGTNLTAGFVFGLNIADLSKIIDMQISAGSPVPWLEWLLLKGDEIVIADYNVSYNGNYQTSRTGSAVMIQNNGGYRVPSQFIGTVNDNFITQTLKLLEVEFNIIINKRLKGVFD